MSDALGAAVVGAGYWGPNLARNFDAVDGWQLRWVCDLDADAASRLAARHTGARPTASLDDVLDDDAVHAVAIATPAATHEPIALAAISAGRHVLIEKPLADSVAAGARILDAAREHDVVVMVDHTFCYTPAVRKLRDLVSEGTIGTIQYADSVRVNLGLVQPDVDVVWDLAPHDVSILDFVLPVAQRPVAVSAIGADPIGAGRLCVAHLTLRLADGAIAHVHVNWLSPTKIRSFVLGGSQRTVVWDDLNPVQRVSIFDRGVDLVEQDRETRHRVQVSYRTGDIVAPALPEAEALRGVVGELRDAIIERRAPETDGAAGLRVLDVLAAADRSIAAGSAEVPLEVG